MTIYIWAEHLYNLFTFTVIIPIFLGLRRWQRLTYSDRWVVIFLAVLLLHELLSILCMRLHTRNHFLYYIQTVFVLASVAGVYEKALGNRGLSWKIAALVSVLTVVEVINWVGFNHINSVTLTLSRLLPATYALIGLNQLLSSKDSQSLRPNPKLYVHLGFFLFGAFTAVNAYFKSYFIETSLDLYYLFNTISAMISAVAFGIFSVGFSRIQSETLLESVR